MCIKALGETIGFYKDSKSRRACTDLIEILLNINQTVALKALIQASESVAIYQSKNESTK